ncbi:MAG: hypothetical protein KY460_12905, partial [Actinobacteria bacterium]|nr:hypothetical protein [Actinomycetota bacterium]
MTDQRMRRSTAIAQVEQMVAAADDIRHLAALDFDAPLPAGGWIADRLRLTKRPAAWFLRSTAHPVRNHRLRELLRVWTTARAERQAIQRLRRGELAQCRRHLATVLDNYHDRDWRRDHTGVGVYPEDHLRRAAQAVRELTDAVDDLERQRQTTPDAVTPWTWRWRIEPGISERLDHAAIAL